MAAILQDIAQQYSEYYNATKEPDVDTWPLMSSPLPLLGIIALYLFFVLSLGPRIMSSAKPYSLKNVIIVYNFAIVLVSLVLTLWPLTGNFLQFLYQEGCHPRNGVPHHISYGIASYTWYYFLTKIIELADTVFFVLRKKENQLSFLHIYHHSSTALYSWIQIKYLPGAQTVVMGFLNSGVHVLMYFYYMLAAMGPAYHKYIWWKKYMTWIQLIQFVIMMTYMSGLLALNCELPKPLSVYFIFISVTFFFLFIDFYRKTYKKKAKD